MPTPDRYPHDLRTSDHGDTYRCDLCGMIDPDDGTESECPVLLRAEVDRLTEALRVATAHPRVRVTRSVRPEIVIVDDDTDWTPEPDDPHIAHTLARGSGMAGQPGGPPAYPEPANPSIPSNGCEPTE